MGGWIKKVDRRIGWNRMEGWSERKSRWMDGQMNGWMDGGMDGGMDGWRD